MTEAEIMQIVDPFLLFLLVIVIIVAVVGMVTVVARDAQRLHEDLVLQIMRSAPPSVGLNEARMMHLCGTLGGLSQIAMTRTLDRLVEQRIIRRDEDEEHNYIYRFQPHEGTPLRSNS